MALVVCRQLWMTPVIRPGIVWPSHSWSNGTGGGGLREVVAVLLLACEGRVYRAEDVLVVLSCPRVFMKAFIRRSSSFDLIEFNGE